ncbi:MAG: cysteine desulfurase family protein [Dehalococcoidales bacterium]|jgi:cysteine desulfurase|nr:cysteine desulfurase family protein [Dehalococcoidales bacterium]MDD3265145.1 cysteine desulfurase family protein [Dehalococcoidales bacterium]MDD4322280.1 cysteine desulfurase family protein [Dehalococcoidales bacterium]MDD4794346.1 cysteine desulfurase family protein [Dehalococcoidales bacterium]MDD5122637.1 cysteine desulfurase family protein [Dehalococcoidales bacterium]
MEKPVYLDYSATTPVDPEVLDTMLPYFSEKFGNASSIHVKGKEARLAVEEAREKVAGLINASSAEEIIFTSGGTEADNMAISGTAAFSKDFGNHIVVTNIEHHAVFETCHHLEKQGFEVTFVPAEPDGIVDAEKIRQAVTDETILISTIYANNEIGTIQPVKDIAAIAMEYGIYSHTDAVQAISRENIDVKELGVDMLSLTAHKFYGPKGIGALYIRQGSQLTPIIYGGGQERGLRSGTESVPLIVGFGKAAEIAKRDMEAEIKRLKPLRDRLVEGVMQSIEGVLLNGSMEKRLPNNANFCFEGCAIEKTGPKEKPEDYFSMSWELNKHGICASAGAACTAAGVTPSHVLIALGRTVEQAQGALRFSLGKWTTEADIDKALEELPKLINRLREEKKAQA